jgi:hypothetical protein
MTERSVSGDQQNQLEQLVDACGLNLVLGALANETNRLVHIHRAHPVELMTLPPAARVAFPMLD